MSDSTICPACDEENIENAHFCVSCGTNLQLHNLKEKQISIEDFESSVDQKELDTVRHLLQTIEELSPYEQELEEQIQYEKAVEKQLLIANNKVETQEKKLQKEQADVEELESFTLTSLIARIKGEKEERLSKEVEERVFAEEKLEALREDRDQVEKELEKVRQERKELEILNQQLQSNQQELKSLLSSIFEGENHPEEDELEEKRNDLQSELSKLRSKFDQIRSAKNHMQGGYKNLRNAHEYLSSAKGYATWDSMFGGGLIVDSMKHSKWNDARRYMRTANSQIERARAVYPDINAEFVNANRSGSDVFDVWFDNIFSDFRARDEIRKSKDQVARAMKQASMVVRDLSNKMKIYERNLNDTQEELEQVKQDLNEKRLELVEGLLSQKK